MEYLSNIELYYSSPGNFSNDIIILEGEDFSHAVKVMRHHEGEEIYVTNGQGKIFKCVIESVKKGFINLIEKHCYTYENKLEKINFCLPKLKSADRFEFALEKCVELGITNFLVYDADREVARGNKLERWNKIALSAMKQSLRSFLPKVNAAGPLSEPVKREGKKYVFDQGSKIEFKSIKKNYSEDSYFFFGPEGGLSEKEFGYFVENEIYRLTENRLRSETAIIVCATLL